MTSVPEDAHGQTADRKFQTAMSILVDREATARFADAIGLVEAAAGAKHAGATERRAVLECVGVSKPANWETALDSLAAAAELGSQSAARQLILLAEDRFEPGQPAGDWKALRNRIAIADRLRPPAKGGRVLSTDPFVRAINSMCSAAECEWLINAAMPRLERATVYSSGVDHGRTNQSAVLDLAHTDLIAQMIRTRIANELGAPLPCLEIPQVLCYAVGEEFVLHCDFLDPRTLKDEIERSGQRSATFLIYLNEDYEGGETSFPVLGIDHRGKTGDALIFGNLGPNRNPDPRTQHAGLPPTSGLKWVFSQWIRDRY
jgi:prolyl 4-hydroxylase